MREYFRNNDLFEYTKSFYDKKQRDIKLRELYNEYLDVSKVTDDNLEDAGVSKREFD